jgi:hypothetical protein
MGILLYLAAAVTVTLVGLWLVISDIRRVYLRGRVLARKGGEFPRAVHLPNPHGTERTKERGS